MRTKIATAFLLAQVTVASGQDARLSEITVIDEACQERSQLQCMRSTKGGCDGGVIGIGFEQVKVVEWPFPINVTVPTPVCYYSDLTAASKNPEYITKMRDCHQLVGDFPTLYGEQCLKRAGGERMLAATGPDLMYLLKKLCVSLKLKGCDTIQ